MRALPDAVSGDPALGVTVTACAVLVLGLGGSLQAPTRKREAMSAKKDRRIGAKLRQTDQNERG